MNFNEKINAITDSVFTYQLILIVFTGNLNYLYIPLSVILLFYLCIYLDQKKHLMNIMVIK